MSRSLRRRKNHWTNRVHESVLARDEDGALGLELRGGAEHGLFPVIGELATGAAPPCHSGKLWPDELLLEVNDTPVAGLTTRDVHAVVKHSKEPVRLKCVKQGERLPTSPPLSPSSLSPPPSSLRLFAYFSKVLSYQQDVPLARRTGRTLVL